MNLVENYKRIFFVDFSSIEKIIRKSKIEKLKIIAFLFKDIFIINDDNKVNVKSQILIQILSNVFRFEKIVIQNRVDDFVFSTSIVINIKLLKRDRDCFKKNNKQ